jgi:D-3-phosphoglycerate dehydrogenase
MLQKMAAKKILLIDTLHEVFTKELTTAGYQVIDATDWALEKILEYLPNCTGVAIRSRFTIDKKFIDTATQLVFICRAGAGMENIDIAYAQSKNIVCITRPKVTAMLLPNML